MTWRGTLPVAMCNYSFAIVPEPPKTRTAPSENGAETAPVEK